LSLEELQIILNNHESPLENGQYYIRVLSENSLIGPFEKRNDGLFPKIGKEVPVYTINSEFMETYVYNSKYLLFMTPDHIEFENKSMIGGIYPSWAAYERAEVPNTIIPFMVEGLRPVSERFRLNVLISCRVILFSALSLKKGSQ
jgi:hypothetical protein